MRTERHYFGHFSCEFVHSILSGIVRVWSLSRVFKFCEVYVPESTHNVLIDFIAILTGRVCSVLMTRMCISYDEIYGACDDGDNCRRLMLLALKVASNRQT
jgi:hypothetical protein